MSIFEGTHEIWLWRDAIVEEVSSWGRHTRGEEEKGSSVPLEKRVSLAPVFWNTPNVVDDSGANYWMFRT